MRRGILIVAIVAIAAVVAGAAAYAELVLDIRTRASNQTYVTAVGLHVATSLVRYNEIREEMRAKHGDRADVSLSIPDGPLTVRVDGILVYEAAQPSELEAVVGFIAPGEHGAYGPRFPFLIEPGKTTAPPAGFTARMRAEFSSAAPADLLRFADADWRLGECRPLGLHLGLGRVGSWLRLDRGTACMVSWIGPRPASMLIVVGTAEGDPWLRPFTGRICRAVVDGALAGADRDLPEYAACVLVDRPGRRSAREALTVSVFDVGLYASLGVMRRRPTPVP
jgi:hypothetical protein